MLSIDAGRMREVDTRNVENLFGMWSGEHTSCATDQWRLLTGLSVFSKCADSMENGRRLENLSWRIWNRETLCCETQPQLATTPAIDIAWPRPRRKDIPELSKSVDSLSSEDSDDSEESRSPPTAPVEIVSSLQQNSPTTAANSRGREKHITSLGLQKMVYSINDKPDIGPLSPSISDAIPAVLPSLDITPRPTSPTMNAPFLSSDSSSSTAPVSSPESEKSGAQVVGSDTSAESMTAHHSVVRGFSPNQVSSSYRSNTHLAPTSTPTRPIVASKPEDSKKSGMFMLGGSSGDEDSSFEDRIKPQPDKVSTTTGPKRAHGTKKTLSFRDEVVSRQLNNKSHEDEGVFESSDEEEDSAIESEDEEEDDDEDWEDDDPESNDNTTNIPLFQRVDSKPNLASHKSLLTTLMNEGDRAAAFQNMASRSTPALRRARSSKGSPPVGIPAEEDDDSTIDASIPMLGPHMTRSKPIIMTTSNGHQQMALSPRTTRRNMLSTEMTESLRKHVLWERQQKKATANAVLKRRHTAHNLTNLKEYPGQEDGDPSQEAGSGNNSWNFGHGVGEYHQVGW